MMTRLDCVILALCSDFVTTPCNILHVLKTSLLFNCGTLCCSYCFTDSNKLWAIYLITTAACQFNDALPCNAW